MKKAALLFLVSIIAVSGYAQHNNDSLAIIRLLEKESATWRSGDVQAHAACWQIRPYSRIFISLGDSTALDVPPAVMLNPPPGMMGGGGTSINTNYTMSIHADNAWVSHNEESTDKTGKKSYSYEIRLLEKIKGDWKLVGQSIHLYRK